MTQQSVSRHEPRALSRLNTIRCKRGRALFRARRGDIVRIGEHDYRVPSQYDGGLYNVCLKSGAEDCTCPDFTRYGRHAEVEPGEFACKHIYAALMLAVKTVPSMAIGAPDSQAA